jgi:FkbM family methyltransferase
MNKWIKIVNDITWSKGGRVAAAIWHKLAPPLVISRKIFGCRVCMNIRDQPFALFMRGKDFEEAEGIADELFNARGSVWDVGCNSGVYTLGMAKKGISVVAFDISPAAMSLLWKGVAKNNFVRNVRCVTLPLTVEPVLFTPPTTARANNRMEPGHLRSMCFDEAAMLFGIPAVIKMDIEGSEYAFFRSKRFRDFIVSNNIKWVVELHHGITRDVVNFCNGLSWKYISREHLVINP